MGIWYGEGKPSNVNDYFATVVEELMQLMSDGLTINGFKIFVKIRCFICDTPARSLAKGIVNFNHRHGCQKCMICGTFSKEYRVMSFPKLDCPIRTDENFRQRNDTPHHKPEFQNQILKIEHLQGFDMIKDFVTSDPLHLLELGVTKKCILRWKEGTKSYKKIFKKPTLNTINQFLSRANIERPSEIHRSIRPLDVVRSWKGTEFRTFLMYVGVVVLKNVINSDEYELFKKIYCATVLCSSNAYTAVIKNTPLLKKLINDYVEGYKQLYGAHTISSNIHNLCHLPDDVLRFGNLNEMSTYPFETILGKIKTKLKGMKNPIKEIGRKISEIDSILLYHEVPFCFDEKVNEYPQLKFPFKKKCTKFQTIIFEKFRLSSRKFGDKYFMDK